MVENRYFLYSLQLKFLGMTHHMNFRDFNACVVHIFVLLKNKTAAIFSSPEPKAHGELIVYRSIRRPCVRASVRA